MKSIISFTVTGCLYMLCMVSCTKEHSELSLSASASSQATGKSAHFIGEHFGGGVVFYIDSTGQHGLICSAQDIEEAFMWTEAKYSVTGAKAAQIGGGAKNTFKIVQSQGDSGEYAARECYNFHDNGYYNWCLPSKDELNEMYKQKDVIGGFNTFSYWSSTEYNHTVAWFQNFSSGEQIRAGKTSSYAARPIRYF